MLNQKVEQFFQDNPEATEVHLVLGECFKEHEAATLFMGGVQGVSIQTISKETTAGGTADQQPNGTTNTEEGATSINKTKTDQQPGNGDPGDEQDDVDNQTLKRINKII